MKPMCWLSTALACVSLLGLIACGGGGGGGSGPPDRLSIALSPASALVYPGQSAVTVNVTLTRQGSTGSVTLTVQGLPAGATANIQSPNGSNAGSVALSASTAAASSYPVTVTASDGVVSGSASLSLTVGAVA